MVGVGYRDGGRVGGGGQSIHTHTHTQKRNSPAHPPPPPFPPPPTPPPSQPTISMKQAAFQARKSASRQDRSRPDVNYLPCGSLGKSLSSLSSLYRYAGAIPRSSIAITYICKMRTGGKRGKDKQGKERIKSR